MAGREFRAPDPDDWFAGLDAPSPRQPQFTPRPTRRNAIAAVGLVAVLAVALSIAAVLFGGSSHSKLVPTTTAPATTTPPPTTTTAPVTQPGTTAVRPPTATLSPGEQGIQVRALQRSLARLGYKPGAIDGKYGPRTEKGVKAFQAAEGLTADGVVGPKTLAALRKQISNPGRATHGAPGHST